jgi:5-methylcytosine-specific restriction endonuclease McrA
MIVEKPHKKITLVLTASFQAVGFFNARSTIRNLMVGAVRGVDNDGNIYDWKSWLSRTDFPDDQPCLRSSSQEFPIPTICVIPGFFGNFNSAKKKFKRTSTLRQIFNIYDGTCQYCLKPIQYKFATKDHYQPKSKGGVNYDSNIVLACKKCNNKKASRFPFLNAQGHDPAPKVLDGVDFLIKADNIPVRPEWIPFLPKS